jgi:hypothetical protein
LHEASFGLAATFYDQTVKEAARRKQRLNLAHPAFGVAQLAMARGHTSAERHYAMLAQLADVLGEPDDYRAGAYHVLSNRLGHDSVEEFIQVARESAGRWNKAPVRNGVEWPDPRRPGPPIYPEALLAAYWLPTHKECVLDCAQILRGRRFVDVLFDAAEKAATNKQYEDSGTLFEAACGLLLSSTPGFEILGGRKDRSSQTDFMALYRRDEFSAPLFMPEGYFPIECKHWSKPVEAQVVRDLGGPVPEASLQAGYPGDTQRHHGGEGQ